MLLAAADAVASQVTSTQLGAPLLPPVENLRASSAIVAAAVIRSAVAGGVADPGLGDVSDDSALVQLVQDAMWQPVYADDGCPR
jgi:malate dehydrogenase (oxaloacetate-decarboxylating)